MDYKFYKTLEKWPKPFIQGYALQQLIQKEGQAFHSFVKRIIKKELLLRIRRGLYVIDDRLVNLFELAQELHGPSFISFESALSHHGWIPEAVYTTTSTCLKRSLEINTPLGLFSYSTVSADYFYLGVERYENDSIFLIATPWRAIADLIHTQNRNWKSVKALCNDMRIEPEDIWTSNISTLEELATNYPNNRVKKVLYRIVKTL